MGQQSGGVVEVHFPLPLRASGFADQVAGNHLGIEHDMLAGGQAARTVRVKRP